MECRKAKKDFIYGLVFCIFSLFMIIYAIPAEIKITSLFGAVDTGVDARTIPYMACYVILVLSVIEMITGARNYIKSEKASGRFQIQIKDELRALLVFILFLTYALLLNTIGFLLASLIAPAAILAVLGDKNWKHYLAVACVALALYAISKFGLNIYLP